MPSSTSSSEASALPQGLRLTAADRPGMAQPVPERDIPAQPWGRILAIAVLLAALLFAGWEQHWRAFGSTPGIRNSDGLWAQQRRRIDEGEGARTVIIGSSRLLFDIDLDTWERVAGERPIQLALEGTSSVFVLEDLAADPNFTGRLIIGVTPELFFGGSGFRRAAISGYHREGPALRVGQWLSMHLVEPVFAFYDPDFALGPVLRRQDWPERPDMKVRKTVRKLSVSEADRNTQLWHKVEDDPEYRNLCREIWAQRFGPPDPAVLARQKEALPKQLERAAKAVATLKARGVPMVFVRAPSTGPFLEFEQRAFPRATTWDPLLAMTGVRGIHFEDEPTLQGYELPEWSHLAVRERPRFTEALVRLLAAPEAAPTARPGTPGT